MNAPEETNPDSPLRLRSLLACSVGLLLCLVLYVLSYPFGSAAARRFPSPVDDTVRSGLNTLYIPIDHAMDSNQSIYTVYDWYLATFYQTFPGEFEMPVLLPILPGEHAPLICIDPPPGWRSEMYAR